MRGWQQVQQVTEQFQCCGIGPVNVLNDQQYRPLLRFLYGEVQDGFEKTLLLQFRSCLRHGYVIGDREQFGK